MAYVAPATTIVPLSGLLAELLALSTHTYTAATNAQAWGPSRAQGHMGGRGQACNAIVNMRVCVHACTSSAPAPTPTSTCSSTTPAHRALSLCGW